MVKKKKQPLKPSSKLSSIVFSQHGHPYIKTETLPQTKEELELAIGKKFLGAMLHFYGFDYADLQKVEDVADLYSIAQNGIELRIQLVEAVEHKMRQIFAQRQNYLQALYSNFPEVINLFSGYRLTLTDAGDEPVLPFIKTLEGQYYLKEIALKLKEIGEGLNTLEDGKLRVRKWLIGELAFVLISDCERIPDAPSISPALIHWGGGYKYSDDETRYLIMNVIEKKIKMYYAKPSGDFWLVVYSNQFPLMPNNPEIIEAKNYLQNSKHPFDKVWFFFPYDNQDLGHVIQLYPHTT